MKLDFLSGAFRGQWCWCWLVATLYHQATYCQWLAWLWLLVVHYRQPKVDCQTNVISPAYYLIRQLLIINISGMLCNGLVLQHLPFLGCMRCQVLLLQLCNQVVGRVFFLSHFVRKCRPLHLGSKSNLICEEMNSASPCHVALCLKQIDSR